MTRSARAPKSLPSIASPPPPAWTSMAAGAAFLAAYLIWAPQVSGPGDSSEFTVVLSTLGLAHPTGYPIYTVVGHLFVRALHALGARWAWAANAWSALGGAVAMALWHAFATRLLERERVGGMSAAAVALLPAVAFGLNPIWTAETTLAEINSWHLAWVAGACLFASTSLHALPARRGDTGWVAGRVAAWSLLVGLGISHHATAALVAIPLTIALLVASRLRKATQLVPAASGGVVLLLAWSYVFFRSTHPAAVQWGSLGGGAHETWNHVTAAGYRHYLGSFAPSPSQQLTLSSYVYPWLVPGLIAALLWAFANGAKARSMRLALAGAALLQTAYALLYGVSDPSSYFLPALALGVFLLPVAATTVPLVRRFARPLIAGATIALAVAAWIWGSAATERRSTYQQAETLLHTMWNAVPIQRGYVLWDDDMCYRLVQYQQLNHEKSGLVVVRPRLLMDDGARHLFAQHHGFDPLGGATPPPEDETDSPARIQEFAASIAEGINRATPDSVILFLPLEPSLRLLPKPSSASQSR